MAFEPRAEVFDDIAPHPEGVDAADELIHERAYVVRAYRKGLDTLVLRGAIRDQKPPGLYVPTDPEALTVHHMIVDMHISVPSLEIIDAKAVLETHPHAACPKIEDHYQHLIGLSIARGFTHKVREMFGGPRGCTHITALLQAMAPVAVQSVFGMGRANRHDDAVAAGADARDPMAPPTDEERRMAAMVSLNSCHMWDEEGDTVRRLRAGESIPLPLPLQRRLASHGLDPNGPVG